jgi:hypothetical protein
MQQSFGAAPLRFSVGDVIGASLALLRRNFWQFFAVALVIGIPLLALSLALTLWAAVPDAPPTASGPQMFSALGAPAALRSMVLAFVAVLTYFMIQAAINYGALQDLRGERPAVGRCIGRGIAVLPRVFAASLVLFLGLFALTFVVTLVGVFIGVLIWGRDMSALSAIGAIATLGVLVLALFLFAVLWVFVPAIVVENAGPLACLGRSRRLTKGHRWGILGIMLLVLLANVLCSIVIGMIARFGMIATGALLNAALALAFTALSAVLTAVGYYALRAEKENFGVADLARVFS